jgi:hypothetical protein
MDSNEIFKAYFFEPTTNNLSSFVNHLPASNENIFRLSKCQNGKKIVDHSMAPIEKTSPE